MIDLIENAVKARVDGELVDLGLLGNTGSSEEIAINEEPKKDTKLIISVDNDTVHNIVEKEDLDEVKKQIPQYSFTAISGVRANATLHRYGKVVYCVISVKDVMKNLSMPAWETYEMISIPNGYKPIIGAAPLYPLARQDATSFIPVYYGIDSNNATIVLQNQSGNAQNLGVIHTMALVWITT